MQSFFQVRKGDRSEYEVLMIKSEITKELQKDHSSRKKTKFLNKMVMLHPFLQGNNIISMSTDQEKLPRIQKGGEEPPVIISNLNRKEKKQSKIFTSYWTVNHSPLI